MRFQVLMATKKKVAALRDVAPCSLVDSLLIVVSEVFTASIIRAKIGRRSISTRLHFVTSQRTVVFRSVQLVTPYPEPLSFSLPVIFAHACYMPHQTQHPRSSSLCNRLCLVDRMRAVSGVCHTMLGCLPRLVTRPQLY